MGADVCEYTLFQRSHRNGQYIHEKTLNAINPLGNASAIMAIIKRQEITVGEGMEKRKVLGTVGGNENQWGHNGKTVWSFPRKLKVELSYDTTISLLNIYSKTPKH